MKTLLKRIYKNMIWVLMTYGALLLLGAALDAHLIHHDRKELLSAAVFLVVLVVMDYARDKLDQFLDRKGDA